MGRIGDESPAQLAARLRAAGIRRACLVFDPDRRGYGPSHPLLQDLADELTAARHCADHEAVFLQVASAADALLTAFVHRTSRGQAQGGLRRRHYPRTSDLLSDGLRLSRAMTRKNALAALWWGGGKGILADVAGGTRDRDVRARLYGEYGSFVSSLRGCYVTAADAGTDEDDMARVFAATRFSTCVPTGAGGSGDPSASTAAGVLAAIEAALDACGRSGLEGRTVAIQGMGHVGCELADGLLRRGARVVASEVCPERRAAVLDRLEGQAIEVRLSEAGDTTILEESCDVLAPCALGGVLDGKTIPGVQARIVCGAANNPLGDEEADAEALARRGIVYVPDFVANRMGIVQCANEQYGYVNRDPAVVRHLDRAWSGSIYQTTRRVIEMAERSGSTPFAVAASIADELAEEPHPIWGHRARRIIESLVADRWERQRP
jgi:glutamate dehydrogenase/leucine dehydrogenase